MESFKKENQFFATPMDVAEMMMEELEMVRDGMRVLEPSAGDGALIRAFVGICEEDVTIVAIEKNNLLFGVLGDYLESIDNGKRHVVMYEQDFMDYSIEEKFDIIIANPPFSGGQDVDHIRKMYDHLYKGGMLVSLSGKGWTFNEGSKYRLFREWLFFIGAKIVEIEGGKFKSSGTMVPVMMIVIKKPL